MSAQMGTSCSASIYFIAGPAGLQNPNADGTGHSNPPSALPSLVLPPSSILFVISQGEGQHHSNSEAPQQAGDRPPADPSQRIITAHLMQCWKDHQYVLGHVVLAWSEEYLKLQSVQRIPAVLKDERDTIFHEHFQQTDTVDPNAPPANPAAPAEKKKTWNLNWGPLSWMADMSAQRPVTRFCLDLWMSFICRSMGVPILMLQAHAVARTMRLCKNFSLDPQGDHVLTCKKHTRATRGHNHVLDVWHHWPATQPTLCASIIRCRTAAASNKQGDVEHVNFGLVGSNNLVIDVLICCEHIGNSTVNNGHLNSKMHNKDYLQARAGAKNGKYKEDYAAVGTGV